MSFPKSPHSGTSAADSAPEAAGYENTPQDPGNKLKRQLIEVLRRWYWIVLFAILGYAGAHYYLSKATRQYTANTTLLIKQYVPGIITASETGPLDPGTVEGMNTIAEQIRSIDLLELVARRQDIRDLKGLRTKPVDWIPSIVREKLNLPAPVDTSATDPAPEPAQLGGMIASWTRVSIRRGTRLMDISVTHPVPEVASKIADAIAREYLADNDSELSRERARKIVILEEQKTKARNDLQASNGALATYQRAIEAHQLLDNKEIEMTQLVRRYLPKHPKMVSAVAELEAVRARFLAEFDSARLAGDYWAKAVLPDREEKPEEYLQTARQQLLSRIAVLQSEINSSTGIFNAVLTRMDSIFIDGESRILVADISSFARVPGGPSSPNRKKILSTGSMGGIAAGLLLALLLARLDNTFHTVAQVAAETGAPILAAISDIKTRHLSLAERDHHKRLARSLAPAPSSDETDENERDWDDLMLFRPGTSATSYAEMFRVLRASVSLLGDENLRKVTLFTSAIPGEGKSFVAANFALAAAGQGKKTLLIDLDLRKPTLHRIFGVARAPEKGGITDCLANQAKLLDVVTPVEGQKGLDLVVSGKRAPDPGELLESGKIRKILALACQHYDVVVLDSAPLLAVPDTRLLSPLAHNVGLVVRADYAPKSAVARALKLFEEDRTHLSGVVVNGYKERRSQIGENGSYGYYQRSRSGRTGTYGHGSYGS
jgi:polysaccharide biosynthesis transport protein